MFFGLAKIDLFPNALAPNSAFPEYLPIILFLNNNLAAFFSTSLSIILKPFF